MKIFLVKALCLAAVYGFVVSISGSQANSSGHRIFACNDFPPQKMENPVDGLPGYDVEILTSALARMGYENKIEYDSWNRAKRRAEDGEVDGLCSCSYRPEREDYFLFTDSIGFVSTGIYTRADYTGPEIKTISDLKGKLVGVVDGYNLEAELINHDIKTTNANKEKNAIRMIEANRFDYFYSFKSTTDFLLSRQNKQGALKFHPLDTNPYYVCISKKAKNAAKLQSDLNLALKKMRTDQTIQKIMSKYR